MGTERRLENRRMKVTKRMEVSCLDTGRYFIGETEDVSDSGIRACLDRSPKPGASVVVRLFWDDSQTPVETFGRVAWSSPLPAGEGIEVGLMLGAESDISGSRKKKKHPPTRYHYRASSVQTDITQKQTVASLTPNWRAANDQSIETRKTMAAISSPMHSRVVPVASVVALSRGESFEVDYNGTKTWAKIVDTSEIDSSGRLHISVELKNQHLWKKISGGISDSTGIAEDGDDDQTPPTKDTVVATVPHAWRSPVWFIVQYRIRHAIGFFRSLFNPIHSRATTGIPAVLRHIWIQIPLNTRSGLLQLTDTVTGQRIKRRGQNHRRRNCTSHHRHS